MPSFEKVNYLLRPNKNVERKLMVDAFAMISEHLPLKSYQYVGMGSLWFVDFVLMHRRLGLTDLLSLERPEYADRATFNRPYACISVDATDVHDFVLLPEIRNAPLVAWIDSDEKWNSQIVQDTMTLAGRVPAGSLVMLTLDASVPPGADVAQKAAAFKAIQKFDLEANPTYRTFAPGFEVGRFANVLARALIDQLKRIVRKEGHTPFELFEFYYKDSAPMITVGIWVSKGSASDRTFYARLKSLKDWVGKRKIIEVPHLTPREKLALDAQMGNARSAKKAIALKGPIAKLGIPKTSLRSYERYYKYYPVFLEADF